METADSMNTSTAAPKPEGPGIQNSFAHLLDQRGITLRRDETTTLQVNVGLRCNQTCTHCHLNAGPDRHEMMSAETMAQVLRLARNRTFETIDITGGAPELHPDIHSFIRRAAGLGKKTIFRANLTALTRDDTGLMELLADRGVTIFASFPSINQAQAEALRGAGTFDASLAGLRALNRVGYGTGGTGGELNLVVNPSGAYLPPAQESLEKRFRKTLETRFGISFDHLYSFANVPLGRFRRWRMQKGNLDGYLERLKSAFNPAAVEGVMCRSLMSVSWDGTVYDCDFNQAIGLFAGGRRIHVSQLDSPLDPGSGIAVGDHCFTCTAGAGFT